MRHKGLHHDVNQTDVNQSTLTICYTSSYYHSLTISLSSLCQVSFYIVESQASNHAVREAACACIAELGTKVSPERLRTRIGSLVGALLDCFKDDSWPVRDGELLRYDKKSIE